MRVRRAILAAGLVMLGSGCGAPAPLSREMVLLDFNAASGPPLTAVGYLPRGQGPADAVITELTLWLAPASKPFTLVFPDGHRMTHATVSKAAIHQHGSSIGALKTISGPAVRWRYTSARGEWVEFHFHADDLIQLRICTDTVARPGQAGLSFETPSGEVFAWPVRRSELVRLFGEPIGERREFLLARLGC